MKRNEIPLVYEGGGRFTAASTYWCNAADERFLKHEAYVASIKEHRTWSEHARYMASIGEAWSNLPEHYAAAYPTPTHLRKRGLIECGYFDERMMVLPDHKTAMQVASFLDADDYSVISVVGPALVERKPQSQALKAMGAQQFRESVRAVETWAWALSGTTLEEAQANVGTTA
jgi:hypothetical protein